MDDFIRRAIMDDDDARRDYADWQYQNRRRQERDQKQAQHHREQRNVRAWLAQSASDEVRTTDFFDPGNNGTQQPQTTTMDDASSRQWNEWFAQSFDDHIGDILEIIGEEMGLGRKQLRDDLQQWVRCQIAISAFETGKRQIKEPIDEVVARLDALESTVADLAARISDLEGTGDTSKSALPLRGGRDAAA